MKKNLGQDDDSEWRSCHMDDLEPDSYDDWDEGDGSLTKSNLSQLLKLRSRDLSPTNENGRAISFELGIS